MKHAAAALAAILSALSCAVHAQDLPPPAPAPAAVPAEASARLPATALLDMLVPYGEIIRLRDGEVRTAEGGQVGRNDLIVSIPYAYKRTGVLKSGVKGRGLLAALEMAPAGAPGFYVGTFTASTSPLYGEMWCFLPHAVGGRRPDTCFLLSAPDRAALAPPNVNPHLLSQFEASGNLAYANRPDIDEKPVEIAPDLRLEFRFRGWGRRGAEVEEFAGGRSTHRFLVQPDADGSASFGTLAGRVRLIPSPDDARRAKVEFVPRTAPSR